MPNAVADSSQPTETTEEAVDAKAPFNDLDADIILHTRNNVQFRVFRRILTQASPFFRTMFSLPQAEDAATTTPPIIPVIEDAVTLDVFLRICYPDCIARLELSMAPSVLEAGRKYQTGCVLQFAASQMTVLVDKQPVKIYILACQYGLEELARLAARSCLTLSVDQVCAHQGFDNIGGQAVANLISYHFKCREAALMAVRWADWAKTRKMGGEKFFWQLAHEDDCAGPCALLDVAPTGQSPRFNAQEPNASQKWWFEYMTGLSRGFFVRADPTVVSKKMMMKSFMRSKSIDCPQCRSKSVDDIDAFCTALQVSIRQKQAEVRLNMTSVVGETTPSLKRKRTDAGQS